MGLKINYENDQGVIVTYARIRNIGIEYGKEKMCWRVDFSLFKDENTYKQSNKQALSEYPLITFEVEKDFEGHLVDYIYTKAIEKLWPKAERLLE